jgi:hypothetical protein
LFVHFWCQSDRFTNTGSGQSTITGKAQTRTPFVQAATIVRRAANGGGYREVTLTDPKLPKPTVEGAREGKTRIPFLCDASFLGEKPTICKDRLGTHRRKRTNPERQTVLLCCAVLCCAALCCAVLCCAVLCCAAFRVTSKVIRGGTTNGKEANVKSTYWGYDDEMCTVEELALQHYASEDGGAPPFASVCLRLPPFALLRDEVDRARPG